MFFVEAVGATKELGWKFGYQIFKNIFLDQRNTSLIH